MSVCVCVCLGVFRCVEWIMGETLYIYIYIYMYLYIIIFVNLSLVLNVFGFWSSSGRNCFKPAFI